MKKKAETSTDHMKVEFNRKVFSALVVTILIAVSLLVAVNQSGLGNERVSPPGVSAQSYTGSTTSGNTAYTLDLSNGTLIKGNFANTGDAPGVFSVIYDNFSQQLFVSDLHSNSLFQVNGTSDTVAGSASAGYNLIRMAYDPSNHYVYGALSQSSDVVVLGVGGGVLNKVGTGKTPSALAYDAQNNNIYVANQGSNSVTVINGSTNRVIDTLNVGRGPTALAFDSVNGNMYVANAFSHNLSVINSTTENISDTIPVGTFPDGISVDPLNNMIYVANRNASTVSIINGTSGNDFLTIASGKYPSAVAFDPQNRYMYVTNFGSNSTSIINTTSDRIVGSFKVGTGPQGITYDPYNHHLYVANFVSTTLSVIGKSFGIYPIKFNETGLSGGSSWTVNLSDGQSITSTSSHMTFQLTNGTFSYTVTTSNGSMVAKPSSSTFSVTGATASVSLKFTRSAFISPVELLAIISAVATLAVGWGVFLGIMRIKKKRK